MICMDYWLYNVIFWLENRMEKGTSLLLCSVELSFFFSWFAQKSPQNPIINDNYDRLIGEVGKQTKNVA